jgi:hypothetical protein
MVALERIKEYSELSQEAPEFVQPRPAASWPTAGEISVENLVIRYSVGHPWCLFEYLLIVPSPSYRMCSIAYPSMSLAERRLA